MKFFNIDQHASVISDIAHIFNQLGHEVDDWSLSGHHWVMNKPKARILLSDGKELSCSGVCSQDTCDKFYKQNRATLEKYDAFIACYPVEFAMLYERWNKPIIVVNCVRYEHPNTFNAALWSRLTDFLKRKYSEGTLYYVCNNKGDQFYAHYFTGIWGTHIPSLCEYTNAKYTGTKNRYVLHDRSWDMGLSHELFVHLGSLRNSAWRYSWQNLYDYKGVIHLPYHNGSMSIFEQYTANVPLFMPSKKYARDLFAQNKMLSDLTFYRINNAKEPDDPGNPNSLRNPVILDKWLNSMDFYDEENMRFIQYFDSPGHMEYLLHNVDPHEVSKNMERHNATRRSLAYESWNKILTSLEKK